MNKYMIGIIAAGLLAFAGAADAAELKIGVVNPAKLISESPQADVIRNKLEQEFAPKRRELQSTQSEIQNLQEKFQRDAEVMSQSERSTMESRIRELMRDFRFRQNALGEDMQRREREELSMLQRELSQVINSFAEAEGYDLILTEGVAYRSDALDVTDAVLARIKK